MGVPVALPLKMPLKKVTRSLSLRGVVIVDCPGRRLSSSACTKSVSTSRPGSMPSTTPPTPLPCDSPNEVSLKSVPNVFPAKVVSFSRVMIIAGAGTYLLMVAAAAVVMVMVVIVAVATAVAAAAAATSAAALVGRAGFDDLGFGGVAHFDYPAREV